LNGEAQQEKLSLDADSSTRIALFRLPVRPLRETLLREKLPNRITSALARSGMIASGTEKAGVEVEIFDAPAFSSTTL
jgi:hypothetical protein